jgi:hypothetical protein
MIGGRSDYNGIASGAKVCGHAHTFGARCIERAPQLQR